MDRVLAARYDPAVVHVSGGRIAAVFHCKPQRKGPAVWDPASTCDCALADFDFPRHFPALGRSEANELHVRRYAHANRARLYILFFAGVRFAARAMDFARRNSDWVLGR